ncbi:MAG: hypothetical protein J7J10_03770, partial [Deltaproteobacteria bacterium]|nr:hypothetical protein [Deltaproteobacteria bacterium]
MIISGFRSMVFLFTQAMVFSLTETMGKVLAFYICVCLCSSVAKFFPDSASSNVTPYLIRGRNDTEAGIYKVDKWGQT